MIARGNKRLVRCTGGLVSCARFMAMDLGCERDSRYAVRCCEGRGLDVMTYVLGHGALPCFLLARHTL